MAIAVSDLGTVEDTGNDAQSNFSFGSFGATASDRYLVACITAEDGGAASFTASAVTIGGVSATLTQPSNPNSATQSVIAVALVPTGASGSVVVTWSEAIASDQLCTLLRVTGLSTATAFDTATAENDNNNTTIAGSLDCEAGGVVIATGAITGNRTWTTTLANEAADQASSDTKHSHFAAWETFDEFQTAFSVSATASASAREKTLAAVALTPVTSVAYTLDCDAGTFTLTGQAATLSWGAKIDADRGQFILAGNDATLTNGYGIVAEMGAFTLTGRDAALTSVLSMTADVGVFALTGNDAGLSVGYQIGAAVGSFTLTGSDASLAFATSLTADTGSFALAGFDLGSGLALVLSAEAGSYVLAGQDVEFRFSGWSDVPAGGSWSDQMTTATWTVQSGTGTWTLRSNDGAWVIQTDSDGWTVQ